MIVSQYFYIFNKPIKSRQKDFFSECVGVCIKVNLHKYALLLPPCPLCSRGPVKDVSYLHLLNRTQQNWTENSQPAGRILLGAPLSLLAHSWQRFLLASAFVACPKSFGLFNF